MLKKIKNFINDSEKFKEEKNNIDIFKKFIIYLVIYGLPLFGVIFIVYDIIFPSDSTFLNQLIVIVVSVYLGMVLGIMGHKYYPEFRSTFQPDMEPELNSSESSLLFFLKNSTYVFSDELLDSLKTSDNYSRGKDDKKLKKIVKQIEAEVALFHEKNFSTRDKTTYHKIIGAMSHILKSKGAYSRQNLLIEDIVDYYPDGERGLSLRNINGIFGRSNSIFGTRKKVAG